MDTLRLSSEKSKKVVNSIVSRQFARNGYSIKLDLNAIEVTEMADGTYKAHLSGDATFTIEDVMKLAGLKNS